MFDGRMCISVFLANIRSKKKKNLQTITLPVLRALREIQEEKKKHLNMKFLEYSHGGLRFFFIVRLLDVLYYFILLSFHIAIICFKIYIYVFKK